jgi:molybdopterin-guanine dinucleotide biosynthesis protein A
MGRWPEPETKRSDANGLSAELGTAEMALTALLLTGGLSSRMARDKATLVVEGQPLWAWQLALLRELQPERIWVSARTVPSWAPADVQVVLDLPPSRGPLSGIVAALDRLPSSHLLTLAVDLPRMTSEHLRKLTALTRPGCGVIPRNQNHLEPLVAIYPKEAASTARGALESDDVSLQRFARGLLTQQLLTEYPLAAEEMALYLNANRPADLRD